MLKLSRDMTVNGNCKEGSLELLYNDKITNFRKIDNRSLMNFNKLALLCDADI